MVDYKIRSSILIKQSKISKFCLKMLNRSVFQDGKFWPYEDNLVLLWFYEKNSFSQCTFDLCLKICDTNIM